MLSRGPDRLTLIAFASFERGLPGKENELIALQRVNISIEDIERRISLWAPVT